MSAQSSSESNNDQAALAKYVRELDIPAPFDLETFGRWLERHCRHPVRLIPASMEPGSPSGLFLRHAETGYLYYEQQTSPFHQSHIVLCLAARVLFGEAASPSIDPRLTPDVSPQLAQLMFGKRTDSTMMPSRAETFAFMALNHARPEVLARRDLQQLRLLHEALCSTVPRVASFAVPGSGFQLHHQIIEIRDAMLALRPYRNPQLASDAIAAFQAAGIAGDNLTAAVEASVLAAALKAKTAKRPPRRAGGDDNWRPVASNSLVAEAAWLAKVSQAFAQMPS